MWLLVDVSSMVLSSVRVRVRVSVPESDADHERVPSRVTDKVADAPLEMLRVPCWVEDNVSSREADKVPSNVTVSEGLKLSECVKV